MIKPLSSDFLLSRGKCCGSDCKNCPYKLKSVMRVNDESILGLIDLCNDIKNYINKEDFTFIEVGSYMGESSIIFAEQFPKATIYCIDPWLGGYDNNDSASHADFKEVEQQFDLRIKNYKNIIKLKGVSSDFNITGDVLYLDGSHKYEDVKKDLIYWIDKISTILSGHDYYYSDELRAIHPHIEGVKRAVEIMIGIPDKVYQDSSWLKVKK